MIGVSVGSTVTLDCYVEAYPTPVTYWEKSDATLLEPYNPKYSFALTEMGTFKVKNFFRKFYI